MAVRRPGERPLAHLLTSYRAALDEPIISTMQAPDRVVLPTLGEAYLNPECRIAEVGRGDTPASREWWDEQAAVPDVEAFLAGYLTSPRAARSPLVVLGEPGSGKSKLTEVLAAQPVRLRVQRAGQAAGRAPGRFRRAGPGSRSEPVRLPRTGPRLPAPLRAEVDLTEPGGGTGAGTEA